MAAGYDGAHPWRVAINHALVVCDETRRAAACQSPQHVAIYGLAEGLTANGVAVAGSQDYEGSGQLAYVAFPPHQVRMAYDASTQLRSLIFLLSQTLGNEEDIDETLPACVELTNRALDISGGIVFVLGGNHPGVDDLARWTYGQARHWPAWVHDANDLYQRSVQGRGHVLPAEEDQPQATGAPQ